MSHSNPPKGTDNTELREQLNQLLDFFTEPGQGEKYLKDLEDQILELFDQHSQVTPLSDSPQLETPQRIAAKYVNRQQWAGSTNRIRIELANDIATYSQVIANDARIDELNYLVIVNPGPATQNAHLTTKYLMTVPERTKALKTKGDKP